MLEIWRGRNVMESLPILLRVKKALRNKERCRFVIARDANDKNLYIAYVYMWGSKKKAKEVNLAGDSSKNENKNIGKRQVGVFSSMMSDETLAKHVEFLAIKLGHIPRKDEYNEPLEDERWGC